MGIVAVDGRNGQVPGGGSGERFELPPVGGDAMVIDALDHRGRGRVIDRADPGGDHFEQEFEPVAPCGGKDAGEGVKLGVPHRGVIVGVAEEKRLDDVGERPFDKPTTIGADLLFEGEGAGAGAFHGPPDPEAGAGGAPERIAPEPAIAEDAETVTPGLDREGGVEAKLLEATDTGGGGARHVFHLGAVVEGKDAQVGDLAVAVGRPVDLLEGRILAERRGHDAAGEEELQFVPRGIGGGAAMARHGERAAGIGIGQRDRPWRIVEPAAQQPGHEAVAGP